MLEKFWPAIDWFVRTFSRRFFAFASGEWILLLRGRNSGAVVGARAVWVGAWMTRLGLMLCRQYSEHPVPGTWVPWFGAIFGAAFFAFHGRFASQWQYLATVYNQIKQVEVTCPQPAVPVAFTEWRAGFIEDCEELHLAGKQLFASTIEHWLKDPKVRQAVLEDIGPERLGRLERLTMRRWR